MGFFGFLSGRTAPPAGTPRRDAEALRAALLALNRDSAPFAIREGGPEGADLAAEWRILDARWYEIFAKAGLKRGAQVLLRLDDAAGEVRALDRGYTVEWRAGLPRLAFAAEAFRGQRIELSLSTGPAFREEDLRLGQVHEYRFSTRELKAPPPGGRGRPGLGLAPGGLRAALTSGPGAPRRPPSQTPAAPPARIPARTLAMIPLTASRTLVATSARPPARREGLRALLARLAAAARADTARRPLAGLPDHLRRDIGLGDIDVLDL